MKNKLAVFLQTLNDAYIKQKELHPRRKPLIYININWEKDFKLFAKHCQLFKVDTTFIFNSRFMFIENAEKFQYFIK